MKCDLAVSAEGFLDFLLLLLSHFEMCAVLHTSEGASSLTAAVDGGDSCSEVLLIHLEKLPPDLSPTPLCKVLVVLSTAELPGLQCFTQQHSQQAVAHFPPLVVDSLAANKRFNHSITPSLHLSEVQPTNKHSHHCGLGAAPLLVLFLCFLWSGLGGKSVLVCFSASLEVADDYLLPQPTTHRNNSH